MDDSTENWKGGELGRALNFGDWKNIGTNILYSPVCEPAEALKGLSSGTRHHV